MYRLQPALQNYAWGSRDQIPHFLDIQVSEAPVAEAWFGAHPDAPTQVQGWGRLDALLARHPEYLGEDVLDQFDGRLPYLLKLISAHTPLSLQVHPNKRQAARAYRKQELRRTAPEERNYTDANHKPELLYALSEFHAVCGFRAPRRAYELLAGMDDPMAASLRRRLLIRPHHRGMQAAFSYLLEHADSDAVARLAQICRERLQAGNSPSERTDQIVTMLAEQFPGDAGAVAPLLLNPVTLQPGQALFVPAGCVHAYMKGFGIEIMANSNNVLRAGLTPKRVDRKELLRIVDPVAAPPTRIAPETAHAGVDVFYVPVSDFELSIATVQASGVETRSLKLRGQGPRIILGLEGQVHVRTDRGVEQVNRGEAVFIPAATRSVELRGAGKVAQADVP